MITIFHSIKTILTVAGLFIVTTILPLEAQAESSALEPSTNEDVWIKVAPPVAIDWSEERCQDYSEYESFDDYTECIFDALAQTDNAQSQKWGLSDQVVREKDTIYISIPNQRQPLVFKDYLEPFEEEHSAQYSLQYYDKAHQLLQLLLTMYETQATVIVNLNTGRWQTLDATNLRFSNDMNQVVGFSGRQGMTKDILIWERQKDDDNGRYTAVFASNELYEQDDDDDKEYEVYEAQDISWTSDNKINVDFYYRVNPEDTVAFRVRYSYVANDKESKWQRVLSDNVSD